MSILDHAEPVAELAPVARKVHHDDAALSHGGVFFSRDSVSFLQRSAGNAAVTQLLKGSHATPITTMAMTKAEQPDREEPGSSVVPLPRPVTGSVVQRAVDPERNRYRPPPPPAPARGLRRTSARLQISRHADGTGSQKTTVQRDDAEYPDGSGEAERLDTPTGPSSPGTTNLLPPKSSTYAFAGQTLEEISGEVSGRGEAGKVQWSPTMSGQLGPGNKLVDVTVEVNLTLEMPDSAPPAGLGPKAKAEFERWYKALQAHEQGHIDLVVKHFDGLAKRMIGMKGDKAQKLLETTKAALDAESKTYDTSTGNGTKTGTIIDFGIEQKELEEKKKAESESKG